MVGSVTWCGYVGPVVCVWCGVVMWCESEGLGDGGCMSGCECVCVCVGYLVRQGVRYN